MCNNNATPQQVPGCPEGCCEGTEILCLSIPCPVNIVLLGISLELELPCIRLTSPIPLTGAQANTVLQFLANTVASLGSNLPATMAKK